MKENTPRPAPLSPDEKQALQRAKKQYASIIPPPELGSAVKSALRQASAPAPLTGRIFRYAVCAAACLCLCFVVVVNASPAFAQSLYDLPVLGNVARVFTFTSYAQEEEADVIDVKLPALENTGHTELEQRINYEIMLKTQQLLEDARSRARDYREAFIATGGKEEDFMPVEIQVDYNVHCNNEFIVSFDITKSETSASYYAEQYFYNIDLQSGKELTLFDMLGPDYIDIVNRSVKEQIARRMAEDDNLFYYSEEDGEGYFVTILPSQDFFINEEGHVVVVFPKYAIAPGYMGIQEFEILPE